MGKRLQSKGKGKKPHSPEIVEANGAQESFTEVKIVYEKEAIKKNEKHLHFGFWTKPFVMARLKDAYLNGANDTEASAHAGLIYDSFRQKLQTKIIVEIQGERDEITLRQLFDHWKEQLIIKLKKHILKTTDYSPLISGTSDSWRWLERTRAKEFGLKAGQGSVDGNAPLDINSVVALRAGAVLKKRKLSLK
jgi:hypothetical protein